MCRMNKIFHFLTKNVDILLSTFYFICINCIYNIGEIYEINTLLITCYKQNDRVIHQNLKDFLFQLFEEFLS